MTMPGSHIPGLGPLPTGTGSAVPLMTPGPEALAPQQPAEPVEQRPTLSSMNAARAAEKAETERLEQIHGKWATAGTQAARGVLDAVLAPGALLGAASEGVGELTGVDALRDFGRDLGKASSGKAAIEALGFAATGDTSTGDKARKTIEEQERAWPMLSTVSRLAGTAAVGVAGGAATTAPGALAGMGLAAAEGAAGGAQYAYEDDAPLRDVLSSALLGGAIGGGLAGAGAAVSLLGPRAGRGAEFLEYGREKLEGFASRVGEKARLTVDQVGGKEAHGVVQELIKAKDFIKQAISDAGDNPVARVAAEKSARERIADTIARKAGDFDASKWATETPGGLQKFVFRSQILDRVSDDFAAAVTDAQQLAPKLDFDVPAPKLGKLMRDVDGPQAIGSLQQRIAQSFDTSPPGEIGMVLNRAARELSEADLPTSFGIGHATVRQLAEVAELSTDDLTRQAAARVAADISDTLGSETFGQAGQLYRALRAQPLPEFSEIGSAQKLRELLRSADGRGTLERRVTEQTQQTEAAWAARAKLTGEKMPGEVRQALKDFRRLASRAEEATTLDSGPVGRVINYAKGEIEGAIDAGLLTNALASTAEAGIGGVLANSLVSAGVGGLAGGVPGMVLGYMVSRAVRPRVTKAMATVIGKTEKGFDFAKHVAPRAAVDKSQQELQAERVKKLERIAMQAQAGELSGRLSSVAAIPPALAMAADQDMQRKIENLQRDLPKPTPNIRGKSYETLSASDVRLWNAMFEATFEPFSIFDDFQGGSLDYSKLDYVWKQNPGLQQAVQAGIMDSLLAQLTDDERAGIPEGMLTQLDYLGGFNGGLQESVGHEFSSAMDAIGQQAAQQAAQAPAPKPMMQTPKMQKTFTQRIAGA